MHQSRQLQLRPPFKHSNISSSSLEGMEKPVRSFKSFMRSVPANPTEGKPLPPVPAKESSSRLASRKRSSSIYSRAINSWEAPAPWRSSSNEPSPQSTTIYLQPTTFNSGDSQSPDVNHSLTPVSEPRMYSPILSNPSPDPTEPNIELGATLPSKPSSVNQSKPTTVPEDVHSDIDASRAPPQSSLPPPPVNIAPESLAGPLPRSPLQELPVANLKKMDSKTQAMQVHPITSSQPVPSTSIASKPPPLRSFPPYKAVVSLGLEKAGPPPILKRNVTRSRRTPPRTRNYTHYIQTERRFTPGQAQGAKNRGNVTDSDSWEDEDMNYHSLLVEQYRGLAVHDYHADKKGRAREGRHHNFMRDPELIPHPLSWLKASSGEQRSDENGNGVIEKTNERTASRRESLFKMPLRLSLTNKVQKQESPSGDLRIPLPQRQETISSTSVKSGKSCIGVRKPSRHQPANPDQRFSTFYPRAKPLTSAKKKNKKGKQKAAYVPPLPLVLTTTLAPSPRTAEPAPHPPFALQEPRISLTSILQAPSSLQHSSSYPASMERGARTPLPLPSPTHSHSHSRSHKTPLSSPTAPKALANAHTTYDKLRASLGSLSTPFHVHSTTPPSPQRPLFVHERTSPARADPTPLPPPPPPPQLSSWRMAHPDADTDVDAGEHKPGFLAKALEARKRRSREVRLLKLKRSIRVLGPTDPRGVEGFEGRRPGYLGDR